MDHTFPSKGGGGMPKLFCGICCSNLLIFHFFCAWRWNYIKLYLLTFSTKSETVLWTRFNLIESLNHTMNFNVPCGKKFGDFSQKMHRKWVKITSETLEAFELKTKKTLETFIFCRSQTLETLGTLETFVIQIVESLGTLKTFRLKTLELLELWKLDNARLWKLADVRIGQFLNTEFETGGRNKNTCKHAWRLTGIPHTLNTWHAPHIAIHDACHIYLAHSIYTAHAAHATLAIYTTHTSFATHTAHIINDAHATHTHMGTNIKGLWSKSEIRESQHRVIHKRTQVNTAWAWTQIHIHTHTVHEVLQALDFNIEHKYHMQTHPCPVVPSVHLTWMKSTSAVCTYMLALCTLFGRETWMGHATPHLHYGALCAIRLSNFAQVHHAHTCKLFGVPCAFDLAKLQTCNVPSHVCPAVSSVNLT